MKQKLEKLSKMAKKVLGDETDYIIIAHKDGECGGATNGRTEYIAQALFALMHQENSSLADVVYKLIKLNAMNIIANPSPFAVDLSTALANITPKQDGD